MTIDATYMAYGFNWPYFSYATKFKKILIYNAFNPTFVQRYELPSQVSLVLRTFLTDSHDLFAIVETYDQQHEIYHINLDSEDPRLNGPILKYSWSQVDNQILKGFHVRASSAKEKINLNKVLITYMLHGTDLWSWTGKGQSLELVSNNASNLYYMSDDNLCYLSTEDIIVQNKEIKHSKIWLVESLFGNWNKTNIYEDMDKKAEILNFGVDNTRKRLMILSGIKN